MMEKDSPAYWWFNLLQSKGCVSENYIVSPQGIDNVVFTFHSGGGFTVGKAGIGGTPAPDLAYAEYNSIFIIVRYQETNVDKELFYMWKDIANVRIATYANPQASK